MPEGDTIHKIARAMQPTLIGKRVEQLRLRNRGAVDAVKGETIESIEAVGKHLLVRFSGNWGLRVHLGMKGRWRRYSNNTRRPAALHASVLLATADLAYVCTSARHAELVRRSDLERAVRELGPDLLRPEPDLDEVLRRARAAGNGDRAIGELLLDQSVASGIGNVFKSEVLFIKRIHPWMKTRFIDDERLRSLYAKAGELMRANVRPGRRVTVELTMRRSADRRLDPRLWVYGRIHQRCLVCGTHVDMDHQGDQARSTYWCPTCQKATRGPTEH